MQLFSFHHIQEWQHFEKYRTSASQNDFFCVFGYFSAQSPHMNYEKINACFIVINIFSIVFYLLCLPLRIFTLALLLYTVSWECLRLCSEMHCRALFSALNIETFVLLCTASTPLLNPIDTNNVIYRRAWQGNWQFVKIYIDNLE